MTQDSFFSDDVFNLITTGVTPARPSSGVALGKLHHHWTTTGPESRRSTMAPERSKTAKKKQKANNRILSFLNP